MNCTDIAELAPLFITGELDTGRSSEFDAHLKVCPACMVELEQHARIGARLREIVLAEGVDAARVDRRVRELIAAGTHMSNAPNGNGHPRVRPTARRWVVAAMGIAAVLLLLFVGYRFLLSSRVGRVYADAATDHQREVVEQRPRKWTLDPAEIAALAEQQGVPGSVPLALAPENYRLVGAKLCSLDGRVFLHLTYSDGAKEFSVYLRRRDPGSQPGSAQEDANGKRVRSSHSGNEFVASFETGTLTAMVVTDDSAANAEGLAHAISASL